MTKKAYSGLLMNELVMMEDYGMFLPHRAFEEFDSRHIDEVEILKIIQKESEEFTYRDKNGRTWNSFFWEGELKSNTYLELIQEV